MDKSYGHNQLEESTGASAGPAHDALADGLRFEKAGMLDQALARYQDAFQHARTPAFRSEVLRRQAHAYRRRCDWDRALSAARHSSAAAHEAGSPELLAEAWNAEALVHQSRGDFDRALPLYDQMLRAVGPGRIRGVALQNIAVIQARLGRLEQAERYLLDAYACFESVAYRWGMAHVLNNIGGLKLDRGDIDGAEEVLRVAIVHAREVGDLDLVAIARFNNAEALLARGSFAEAEAEASASLGHFGAEQNQWRRLECLRLLGDIAHRSGDPGAAGRFYTAALELADRFGTKVEQRLLAERIANLQIPS